MRGFLNNTREINMHDSSDNNSTKKLDVETPKFTIPEPKIGPYSPKSR